MVAKPTVTVSFSITVAIDVTVINIDVVIPLTLVLVLVPSTWAMFPLPTVPAVSGLSVGDGELWELVEELVCLTGITAKGESSDVVEDGDGDDESWVVVFISWAAVIVVVIECVVVDVECLVVVDDV